MSSTTAVYDAFTRLVEIQGSSGDHTQMVYAPDGFKFAYMNGQTVEKYIAPLAAGLQAVYLAATPAAPAFWRHSDWLGTVRLDSTPAQGVYFDGGWAPFGEYYAGTGTSDRVFTGQRQDVVGGIWDFMFRQYSPAQGRWMVPDPAGLAAVDITNPQTWNRYAYVGNNPLSNVDPLGLENCGDDGTLCDGANEDGVDGTSPGGGGDPCAYDACVVAPPPDPVSPVDTGVNQSSGVNLGLNVILWNIGAYRLGKAANNGRVPNNITCSTVLPNGRTVGSYVSQVSNGINQQAQVAPVSTPYGPAPNPSFPSPISVASQVYSGTNFRAMFGGPGANYAFLGDAGNFAYGAVSANLGVPLTGAEMVAGAYSLYAHPSSDWAGLGGWTQAPEYKSQRGTVHNANKTNNSHLVFPFTRIAFLREAHRGKSDGSKERSI